VPLLPPPPPPRLPASGLAETGDVLNSSPDVLKGRDGSWTEARQVLGLREGCDVLWTGVYFVVVAVEGMPSTEGM
jgi:hypothetical protein